ncbi:hypothetical protein BDF22DRAFT_418271 [Syncephalis plumigaleata]|nr:hypothetical protein BDF22DRAFT_418271 [Syncephalis plumigaleata]
MNVHHAVRANRSNWLHLLCLTNLLIVWIQQTSCGLLEPLKHLQLFSNQPTSSTTNSRAFNSSVIPRPLSRIADSIYSSMLSIDTNRVKHPSITADQLLTSGRITRHAVGLTGKDHLCRDMFATPIEEAQEEVILSSFLIEKDSECIKQVAEALRKLNTRAEKEGRRVRVYMIVDALALIVAADIDLGYLWHVFKSTNNQAAAAELMQKLEIFPNILNGVHELPARLVGLPDPAEVPSLDLRLRTFHFWPAGTLHSKSMTIDGRRVIIGSQNIDAATGLELLVDMEGPVASVVRQDFYHTWRTARSIDDGHDEYGMPSSATGNTTGVRMPLLTRPTPKMTSDMIPILVAPHGWEERARLYDAMDFQNVAWATAMKMAKRRVFIQTPNINVPAIREIIADTVRRGVQVDVVASYHFEDVGEALYPDSRK